MFDSNRTKNNSSAPTHQWHTTVISSGAINTDHSTEITAGLNPISNLMMMSSGLCIGPPQEEESSEGESRT